jgi:alpha-ketoglutarate-dependent taurine dioxygenase
VRNFISGLDVSWRDFFRTGERAAVEDYCRRSGFEWQWLPDEGLRISQRAPAVARHPVTGELVFFNQVQLHHVSFLEPEVRESLLALGGEDGLPRNVYYGDGSPVPDDVMREIEKLYWRLAVQFRWQEGDILLVDNMIMAHARNSYSGERKILVAMGDMLDKKELAA